MFLLCGEGIQTGITSDDFIFNTILLKETCCSADAHSGCRLVFVGLCSGTKKKIYEEALKLLVIRFMSVHGCDSSGGWRMFPMDVDLQLLGARRDSLRRGLVAPARL